MKMEAGLHPISLGRRLQREDLKVSSDIRKGRTHKKMNCNLPDSWAFLSIPLGRDGLARLTVLETELKKAGVGSGHTALLNREESKKLLVQKAVCGPDFVSMFLF